MSAVGRKRTTTAVSAFLLCLRFAVLLAICLVVGSRLGFLWLILIGLVVADASLDHELNVDTRLGRLIAQRIYGPERATPEQRASIAEERLAVITRLHGWRYLGLLVAALGLVGFLWQLWPAKF